MTTQAAAQQLDNIIVPSTEDVLRHIYTVADPDKWITVFHKADGMNSCYNPEDNTSAYLGNYHCHPADVPAAVAAEIERGNNVYIGKVDRCGKRAYNSTISGYLMLDVDIDCHGAGMYSAGKIASALMYLPVKPHYVVDSGRGVHAWYLLERCPARTAKGKSMVDMYKHVARAVAAMVAPIVPPGCDLDVDTSTSVGRVTRAPGSYNHAAHKHVEIIVANTTLPRYRLGNLYEQLCKIPWERNKTARQAAKAGSESNVKNLRGNLLAEHQLRLDMAKKLVDLRAGNMDGCRDKILWRVRYWALLCNGLDDVKARAIVLELNARFTHPLTEDEAIACGASSVTRALEAARGDTPPEPYTHAGYNEARKKIIDDLKITPQEQKELHFWQSGGHTARDTARAEARTVKQKKLQKQYDRMVANGKTQREITTTLHVSFSTLQKLSNAHQQDVCGL